MKSSLKASHIFGMVPVVLQPYLRMLLAPLHIIRWLRGNQRRWVYVVDLTNVDEQTSVDTLLGDVAYSLTTCLRLKGQENSHIDLVILHSTSNNVPAALGVRLGILVRYTSSVNWMTSSEWESFRRTFLSFVPESQIVVVPLGADKGQASDLGRLNPPGYYTTWAHQFLKNFGPNSKIVALFSNRPEDIRHLETFVEDQRQMVVLNMADASAESPGLPGSIDSDCFFLDGYKMGWNIFEKAALAQKADAVIGGSSILKWVALPGESSGNATSSIRSTER